MRLLALNGQRGAALAQYEACRRALADQLDVEPAAETIRLYEQIRDEEAGLGRAGGQAIVREAGEAEVTPSSLSARRRTSGWRTAGVRWALIGGGLLLLAIAIMQALTFFGLASPGRTLLPPEDIVPPQGNIIVPPEGKIVLLCKDATPPQLCVHEFRTGRLTQVTGDLAFEEIGGPAWSPDGRRIVFDAGLVLDSAGPCNRHLFVIDADGTNLEQLTGGDTCDQIPVWSSDGEWIAFNRNQELWLIPPDGSEPGRLFGEPGSFCVGELKWSPNGQQIAFVGQECTPGSPPPPEVWVIDRDGTASHLAHAFERRPDYVDVFWDQDGLAIICAHAYGGEEPSFLLISADGLGEPHLIDVLPLAWYPSYWPQWGGEE
jgi:hypothetical protein